MITNIAILGICGRMGRALVPLITGRDDCRLVAGIDPAAGADGLPCPVFPALSGLESLGEGKKPDVLIDFSHPDATAAALDYCAQNSLPCVICTTGLGQDVLARLKGAAAKTAVFYSANMSLGVNLLAALVRRAAAALPGFDVEIIEKHHHNKLDAPSGTAMMLADTANKARGGQCEYVYDRHLRREKRSPKEIGLSAVRGGSIVGEHDVVFAGQNEVLTLSHTAYSREVFASGAVAAALFLPCKPFGLYTMDNLLEDV